MINRVPVTFTLSELWLLHDFVRHECPEIKRWAYPPASLELNTEIALAIDACLSSGLTEYTLMMSLADILVVDYNVRSSMASADNKARGKDILIKVFKARAELAMGMRVVEPQREEVKGRAGDADAREDGAAGSPKA